MIQVLDSPSRAGGSRRHPSPPEELELLSPTHHVMSRSSSPSTQNSRSGSAVPSPHSMSGSAVPSPPYSRSGSRSPSPPHSRSGSTSLPPPPPGLGSHPASSHRVRSPTQAADIISDIEEAENGEQIDIDWAGN